VTNKTGSSSDDWIYYQAVTHSLIITLIQHNTALSLVYTVYSPPLHTHLRIRTRTELPSVSPTNPAVRHTENAVLCTVARDGAEVT
jgi:hypothetical protein